MSVPDEHKRHAPKKLYFSIFVVSTSRARGTGGLDVTGEIAEKKISEKGHVIKRKEIIPDDINAIRSSLLESVRDSDVIIFCGGTGIHPTDITPEAIKPLLDKEIPGFGELFRWISYSQIGSAAIASRALAGVYSSSLVFALPGSPDGVELALEKLILPEAPHLVWLVRRGAIHK